MGGERSDQAVAKLKLPEGGGATFSPPANNPPNDEPSATACLITSMMAAGGIPKLKQNENSKHFAKECSRGVPTHTQHSKAMNKRTANIASNQAPSGPPTAEYVQNDESKVSPTAALIMNLVNEHGKIPKLKVAAEAQELPVEQPKISSSPLAGPTGLAAAIAQKAASRKAPSIDSVLPVTSDTPGNATNGRTSSCDTKLTKIPLSTTITMVTSTIPDLKQAQQESSDNVDVNSIVEFKAHVTTTSTSEATPPSSSRATVKKHGYRLVSTADEISEAFANLTCPYRA